MSKCTYPFFEPVLITFQGSIVSSVPPTFVEPESTWSIGIPCSVSELLWTNLDEQDAKLIHYAYSDEYASQHWVNSVLFRRLSSVFTKGIEVPLLRYSILTYFAHYAPNCKKLEWREMQYAKMALKMLSTKLRSCDVGEAELFAAYFLSLRTKWHSLNSIRHYRGCIAMHNVLARNSNPKTQLFKDYGPFICEEYIT